MNALVNLVKRIWANNTIRPALHTFWQAAAAALVVGFGGSGLNLAHLTSYSADAKIVAAAASAGLAAVASLLKGGVVASRASKATTALGDIPDTPDPLADTPDPNTAGSSTPADAASPAPAPATPPAAPAI